MALEMSLGQGETLDELHSMALCNAARAVGVQMTRTRCAYRPDHPDGNLYLVLRTA